MVLEFYFRASKDFQIERVGEKFSSALYKILSYGEFQDIHEKSHTPFTFSPFFPFLENGRFLKNQIYKIEVRSPNFELLNSFDTSIKKRGYIELDYNKLYLDRVTFKRDNRQILKLKSVSPIVIAISDNLAEKYNVEKKSRSFYWTPELNFGLFIEALNRNMVKKWNQWNEKQYPEDEQIITGYRLLKNFPIAVKYKKGRVIGTLWELQFDGSFDEVVKFSYFSGFGGKGGSGFGFMIKS